MNGDGRLGRASSSPAREKLAVRLGNGDGTFGPERATPATDEGENMLDVTLADLNHDGRLDAATASYYGDVGVFLGRGDGTFAPRQSYSTIGKADSVTVADYDADGTLDLADLGADYIPFVRADAATGRSARRTYLEWVLADYGDTADFNQDGRADLAFVLSPSRPSAKRVPQLDRAPGAALRGARPQHLPAAERPSSTSASPAAGSATSRGATRGACAGTV